MIKFKGLFCAVVLLLSASVNAASYGYDSFLHDMAKGDIDFDTATVKCALMSGYTPSQAANTRWSDVSTNEITGTGYTAGGNTVAVTVTNDTTNHRLTLTFPQTTWTNSTLSATRAVCYVSTGTGSTSPLIFQNDFGTTVTTSSGTFTLNASTIHINTAQ